MTSLVTLAVLMVLVLATSHRKPWSLPLPAGLRMLLVTRSDFLLVGLLLGPLVLGFLDAERLRLLEPFSAIALGFVGLHYGLRLDLKTLRTVPLFYGLGPTVQALGGALGAGIPAGIALVSWLGATRETIAAVLLLAAASACSTEQPLELLARDPRYAGSRLLRMLRHLAEMGELPALALFGVAICWRQPEPVVPGLEVAVVAQWLALSALAGVVFGLFLLLLPRVGRGGTGRLLVAGLGAVLFFAGLARQLSLSPLFVSLVAGITVINVPGPSRRIESFVERTERPFVLLLLVVAGAAWQVHDLAPFGPVLVASFAIGSMFLRLAGKTLAGWILARTTHAEREPPPLFGAGLVAQGAISAAMVLDYQQASGGGPAAALVVSVVLLAILATEIASPWVVLRLLARARAARGGTAA